MTSKDCELVMRLHAVSQSLETINHHAGELLQRTAELQATKDRSVSHLRIVGYRLVSLAADLTTLGVDTARWADELDNAIDADG